jgi:uncharacterized membrane protein YfcA
MGLCTIAGIGGGGLIIPTLMSCYVFPTKSAIAISNFSILTCSCTRFIYTLKHRHPLKDTVIIDYNLATIMLPTVIIGVQFGTIIN